MALLPPIIGAGQVYGHLMRNALFFETPVEITPLNGIEIQFFSPSDEFVGYVGNTFDNSTLVKLELEYSKIGGLTAFNFEISRLVSIPFFNQMICKFFINGEYWFTGELLLRPDQDRRDEQYIYEGKGFTHYFNKIKVNKLYENILLVDILKDIVEFELVPQTPIEYDPGVLLPPNILVTKLQFENKTVKKVFNEVLNIANFDYRNAQYIYGINRFRRPYFKIIDSNPKTGYFEGYQYQNPDVMTDDTKIINIINTYRAIEDSQEIEFVSTIQDSDSIDKFGPRYHDITISDFVDTTSAENIASALLELRKQPIKNVKISNLLPELLPFEDGFYFINNKVNNYINVASEFTDEANWPGTISNTTVSVIKNKVWTGNTAFKCDTVAGSATEYIELTLDKIVYFPLKVNLNISQTVAESAIEIIAFDKDSNSVNLVTDVILINTYQKKVFDVTSINNIEKIRIVFLKDTINTIYLDRLEVATRGYFQHSLVLESVKYTLSNNNFLADCSYGEKLDTIIDNIKTIDDDQRNILDIFQKI